jgi:hypothetical protein
MDRLQLEQEEQRLFGGDVDDDGSLCLAMLDVVIRLFGDMILECISNTAMVWPKR